MRQSYLLYDERMGLHRDLSCPDASDTYFENPRRIACIYKKLEILEKKILSRHGTDQYKNSEANITSLTDNSFKNSYLPFPRLESYPAKQSTIQLAHSKRYYEKVKETSSMSDVDLQKLDTIDFTQEEESNDNDMYFCKDTFLAASLACGGVVNCVNAVTNPIIEENMITRAIALVRPPGHHACQESAMGKILLNSPLLPLVFKIY
jgi:histone deacetylase 6